MIPGERPAGPSPEGAREGVWFVYDGDCPLCDSAARALRIRQAAGPLRLVDARAEHDHPVVRETRALDLDLDRGMVLKYQGRHYHGADALHMMALLGSPSGGFNRLNALLFRSRLAARLCYPLMRAARNLLVHLRGAGRIAEAAPREPAGPVLARVIGPEAWARLPEVMRRHYAVRAGSADTVRMEGRLDVRVWAPVGLMARLTGLLVPCSGEAVPVTVIFSSDRRGALCFDRTFRFPGRAPARFRSRMEPAGGDEMIEYMRYGLGWRLAYGWDGQKMTLSHRGYVWRVAGLKIPLPLSLLIGRGYAEETPLDGTRFAMWTHTLHPLFGATFGYRGEFEVVEVTCPDPS